MPSKTPLTEALRSLLAQAPSMPVAALQAATGMSQASVSMALGQLGAAVHKLGAARSTRYALSQPILGLPAQQALHWCDPLANSTLFGRLTLLHSGDVHVRGPSGSQWLAQRALPWFLVWSVPQVLYIAANHITDPPGAFVLGSMYPISSTDPAIPASDPAALAAHYDQLATRSGQHLPAG